MLLLCPQGTSDPHAANAMCPFGGQPFIYDTTERRKLWEHIYVGQNMLQVRETATNTEKLESFVFRILYPGSMALVSR